MGSYGSARMWNLNCDLWTASGRRRGSEGVRDVRGGGEEGVVSKF